MKNELSAEAKELAIVKKQLDIIRNVSSEFNKFISLPVKLTNILLILDEQFGIAHSMILLPDKKQEILSVYASRGYPENNFSIPFGKGMVGMAAEKKIPINLTGLNRKKLYVSAVAGSSSNETYLPGLPNAASQIAIPLLSNNDLIAVLTAESTAPSVFSISDEKFLLTLTTHIALSIQNSMLFDSMEEKIKTRTLELEQLNHTKDKLFSIISHDLRSPVSSFQSIAQLLKHYSAKGETDKIESLSEKIEQSTTKLNFLLDNLLNWSLSQGHGIECCFDNILLKPFIQEVASIYEEALTAKNIALTISISPEEKVWADENTLSVIFRNLISNALKFTFRNGAISITAVKTETVVKISIVDNGIGIEEEKLTSIFTLSNKKTTMGTEKERGTGLGLVLVNEFVQLNNGKINVKSCPGKGTSFFIELPFSEA